MFLKVGDWALLRLHKGYSIPSTAKVTTKLAQQYVGPFKVIERVGRLAYKLAVPDNWRVHPVFSIAQLEPCPSPADDPFERPRPDEPPSVFVEGDTPNNKSYEVQALLNKRIYPRGLGHVTEYLVRWKGYGPEHDRWTNIKDLGGSEELIQQYEQEIRPLNPNNVPRDIVVPSGSTRRGRPRKTAVSAPGTDTVEAPMIDTVDRPDLPTAVPIPKRKPGRPRKAAVAVTNDDHPTIVSTPDDPPVTPSNTVPTPRLTIEAPPAVSPGD